MKVVELYGRVRYAIQIEGLSRREAARQFGIDPRTVAKMLAFSVPPGYRRSRPPARPKLDPFTGIIDGILTQDEGRPRKQRHTSKRIFERLRDEHGYAGGITIVKDYVLARRLRQLEVFVPLRHDPGHAQADFGLAARFAQNRTLSRKQSKSAAFRKVRLCMGWLVTTKSWGFSFHNPLSESLSKAIVSRITR